jgi:tricarballylate dehydrogenase
VGRLDVGRVIVIGAGNAGLCAALAARAAGAEVVVLEAAPQQSYGSDSYFSGGLFRVAYDSLQEIERIVGPMGLEGAEGIGDFAAYPAADFLSDWGRVTGYRTDPDLSAVIVEQSQDALSWLAAVGVPFRSPIVVDGSGHARHSRPGWHGGFIEAAAAGPGLTDALLGLTAKADARIRYGTTAVSLERAEPADSAGESGGWTVQCRTDQGGTASFPAQAVIIASGGFQADAEWRTRVLGRGWDLAKVRGSRHNTGGGIKAALAIGAASHGNWSGCHAVAWSVGSGVAGRRDANHVFERESHPFGVTINVNGRRFIDEGSDFGAYTYAKYGREILAQPGQTAWQIFDAKASDLQTSEYRYKNPEAARATGWTLTELAARLAGRGVDTGQFVATVQEFNRAIDESMAFSPYVRDGRRTSGLAIDKSNWAVAIDTPPFEAYEVTCGITFTFGGLQVDTSARVLDIGGNPLPGLYACGEAVGGLHYFNYASGTGLTSGTVLGRIAGRAAACCAAEAEPA